MSLSKPRGATYDSSDALVVLDGNQLVRVSPKGDVSRAPVRGATGKDLRGLSAASGSDLLYTYDTSSSELLGLAPSGDVGARYDVSSASLQDVQGVVVAPSSDSTDETSVQSLYVADAGSPSSQGAIVEFALTAAAVTAASAVSGSVVRMVETSAFNPPSPDPSGVAYDPSADRLMIGDGEVDEMGIFQNANLFLTTRAGSLQSTGVSQPWSDEPVGVGYDTLHNRLFVCDDDDDAVYELVAGGDGRYGTSDDTVTAISTSSSGNTDPEGVEHDPVNDSLWTVDGVNREVYQYRRGPDGRYGTSDDPRTQFDVAGYGAVDPEGIGYDSVRDTLIVVDGKSEAIYELDRSGTLLNSIDIAGFGLRTAAGVTVAPGSQNSSDRNYYVVTRGVDNNSDPNENDGKLFEIRASLSPQGGGNRAPTVDAGPDSSVVMPDPAALDGSVSDDGQPTPPGSVTTAWSKVSGPGTVTFGQAADVDTTATFSAEGTYVLRLTANDGELTTFDELTVVAAPVGSAVTTEVRVSAGSDDAEQRLSGSVSLTSSDLELTTDGANEQVVGLRFAGVQVPAGATVTSAWVQFRSDEVSATAAATLTIKAEASDNAPTYSSSSGNVTSRTTTGSVAWSPPQWSAKNEAGTAQRTPELSSLVQAVVGRSGWVQGNAVALQISGTGTRTADSFEGGASFAPLLHIEYSSDGSGGGGGGGGPVNQPPTVDAGPDGSVTLPSDVALNGTVADDGLPNPPAAVTTTWSKESGPGTVTFGHANAEDTTASFSTDGTYVLKLTADDSAESRSDTVTFVVNPEPGGGGGGGGGGGAVTTEAWVSAGSDDVEQRLTGSVSLNSSDLELTTDKTTEQVVGVRFAGVQVPAGATVTTAWVQFRADEVSSGTAALTIKAEAADNAPTYSSASGNVTSRTTTGSVAWSPPQWTVKNEAGTAQRTPELASLVQAVIGRSGWAQGNAVALQISGTGTRTADSFEGGASAAPLLHIEYTTDGSGGGGGGGPVNQPPTVNAGPGGTITLPATAALDGTVNDDGLPNPPATVTTTWSKDSGPGTVTFTDANAEDTTASFSTDGTYVLKLTADDSVESRSDTVTFVVDPEPGGGGGGGATVTTTEVRVSAGSDDVEQRLTGSVSMNSSDLELTTDRSTEQVVGLRFAGVQVPAGATVTTAWVQFRADEVSSGTAALTIKAEASNDAATYSSSSGDVTARATTGSVDWSPPDWTTKNEVGPAQQTPELASLVQAVVDMTDWAQGNAVALQISGTGTRTADSYEGGALFAPLLHIEYTTT